MSGICKVERCGGQHYARGLCNKHYLRFLRYGDPTKGGAERNDIVKGLPHKYPKEYNSYRAMLYRCSAKNCPDYKDYGMRGITVCERWKGKYGFMNFINDMGEKPSGTYGKMPKYSIDRIDVNKGYSPENCKWADWHEQASHRRLKREISGVYKRGNTYVANIQVLGVRKVKAFKVFDKAVLQRKAWEKEML